GRGSGVPHLASQGSLALSDDARFLLVANAGSDDVSVLAVGDGAPTLVDRVPSGGGAPTSIAVHGRRVVVLNTREPNVTAFRLRDGGRLAPVEGSTRSLAGADPAQVGLSPDGATLVVTERGTNSLSTFAVADDGSLDGPLPHPSSGATPYGFAFTRSGAL